MADQAGAGAWNPYASVLYALLSLLLRDILEEEHASGNASKCCWSVVILPCARYRERVTQ